MYNHTTTDAIKIRLAQLIETGWAYIAVDPTNTPIWTSAATSRRGATDLAEDIDRGAQQASEMLKESEMENAQKINVYCATICDRKIMEFKWLAEYLEPNDSRRERDFSQQSIRLENAARNRQRQTIA